MEKHVLLKKLRDALESLKGRVAGRNKDDVEEAISMVSCIFLLHFSIPLIKLIPDIKFLLINSLILLEFVSWDTKLGIHLFGWIFRLERIQQLLICIVL